MQFGGREAASFIVYAPNQQFNWNDTTDIPRSVGGVAQWLEHLSLAGGLSLIYA